MHQKLPENFTLPPPSPLLQGEERSVEEKAKGLRARRCGGGFVFAGLLGVGIVPRLHAQRELLSAAQARQEALPIVNVANVRRAAAEREFILPGNTQAFRETAIYARTNGYLKQWFVDIGDHVAAGQLLAVIETPEIDQELAQTQAALAQSQANLRRCERMPNWPRARCNA
jgi:multidrug efflux pump subunit AcrA (membrane-fusion protein)